MAESKIAAGVAQHGRIRSRDETSRVASSLRGGTLSVPLAVVVLLIAVLAIYWQTTLSMVAIWERSETFAHGFVVIPIFCYLLWRRRGALVGLKPRPYWGALLGIAAAGAVWLVGEIVNAASVSQFAMVAMIPFAVWAVLGTRVAMVIGIPLAFLFFAVPFGEFLVPTLMDRTADFTVAALRASGIPVYREGNYFIIPSGAWSVVEACSGLRYLIASLMVGCLYAYLSYRSPIRRIVFIAASLVVPIVANWVRAYLIVLIGHLSSNRLAVGVDHLIYGWLFFGVVIMLLFWIGSRWREDDVPAPASVTRQTGTDVEGNADSARRVWAAALAALCLMVIWQPLRASFDASVNSQAVHLAPVAAREAWVSIPGEISAWRPDLSGARAELRQSFAKDGQRVGLYIAFYRGQTRDTKAISSTNQLVNATNRVWRRIDAVTTSDPAGSTFHPRAGTLVGLGEGLEVWQWYWVDGHVTSNEYEAKLYQAISTLRGHGDPVAWIVIYAPSDGGKTHAGASLQQFATIMRGSIEGMLREAATR